MRPRTASRVLYAYTSQTGNNGSPSPPRATFYNITGAVAMFVGRFFMIVPAMALGAGQSRSALGRYPNHRRLVRRPGRRRDPDCRRTHLFPGTGAWADRRASRDECQHPVLIDLRVTFMEIMKLQKG